MPNETKDAAIRFVDLALKYKQWDDVKTLLTDEIHILFSTVVVAGFNLKEVVLGKLVGHYRDQDGSNTGETYPINELCPYKVIDQDGDGHFFATGWLDLALRRVVYGMTRQSESRGKLIEVMAAEIERSVPLEPIQLTPEGDLLREYPPSPNVFGPAYFVQHSRDTNKLGSTVGVHEFCDGWMDRVRATKTHDAVVCRQCHLRVLFPREAKTYGDLRQALAAERSHVST